MAGAHALHLSLPCHAGGHRVEKSRHAPATDTHRDREAPCVLRPRGTFRRGPATDRSRLPHPCVPPARAARPTGAPAPVPPPALEALFQAIQILATRHRWANQYTYNSDGDDAGLHVILARDVLLFAEVVLTPEALTPHQQAWLDAVRAAGQAEAYVWTPTDEAQIRERLERKRGAP